MIDIGHITDINGLVKIECIDGQVITGYIESFDDKDESGLNEVGIGKSVA